MDNKADKKPDTPACNCAGGACRGGSKIGIWVILILAIAGVLVAKNAGRKASPTSAPVVSVPAPAVSAPAAVAAAGTVAAPEGAVAGQGLPKLVDLGAGACIPCKMMAPVLAELKSNYVGRLEVQFIDVWENPEAGKAYKIGVIPTQIFYDAQGKELFRHEGFYSRDAILAKWKEFGVNL